MIDLRSDTFTKPSPEMLEAMFHAEVGDDVFGEDPTVNELERYTASLFGKEAGLFCSSGTQTNQVAIRVHTRPGDDVICDQYAHIHYYEGGGIAANSGATVSLLPGDRGLLKAHQIEKAIKVDNVHFPKTSLVALENTSNKGGGSIYDMNDLLEIKELCQTNKLKLHLDGARVFNALVERDYTELDIGNVFDSVSICLSKGLGAPVGSVLVGDADFIHQARRVRKRFGGGMRQAGYIAAAGLFALKNNIPYLKVDHENAKFIESILIKQSYTKSIAKVESNIVVLTLNSRYSGEEFVEELNKRGILVLSLSEDSVRFVTHLDVSQDMMNQLEEKLSF